MTDKMAEVKKPSRWMSFAITGAAALVAASGALFYFATTMKRDGAPREATRIEIGATACAPNVLTLPAGRHTFELHNGFTRTVEWEILDGVLVVEEREHMLPGFSYIVNANLRPGSYDIICGLLSNPRGKLTVTETAESKAAAAAGPELKAFIGPLSEYKVFLAMQGSSLVAETRMLATAVKDGDLTSARALYESARASYRKVEAVVGRWSDLQNSIDPVADYFEKREEDPAFSGFHRVEYGLFAKGSTEGLAPVADDLLANVAELNTRLRSVKLEPADLPRGAARLAQRLADEKIESGEDAYSHTDLADFDASLIGITRMAGLLKPLVAASSTELATDLDARVDAARSALADLKSGDAYPLYDKVDLARRKALAAAYRDLAATLAKAADVTLSGLAS